MLRNLYNRQRRMFMKKGFTLIELLIIIVIIGVLVTMALPKYKGALEKGRSVKGVQRAAALSEALNVCYISNYNSYANCLKQIEGTSDQYALKRDFVADFGEAADFCTGHYIPNGDGSVTVMVYRVNVSNGKEYAIKFVNQNGEITGRSCVAADGTTGKKYCEGLNLPFESGTVAGHVQHSNA